MISSILYNEFPNGDNNSNNGNNCSLEKLSLTENLLEILTSEIDASMSTLTTQITSETDASMSTQNTHLSQMSQTIQMTQMTQLTHMIQMTQKKVCDVWLDVLRRKLRILTQILESTCVSQGLTILGGMKASVEIVKRQVFISMTSSIISMTSSKFKHG